MMHWLKGFGFWLLIPLGFILVGAIVESIKMMRARRERQALVAQGIDPDTVRKRAPTLR